MNNIRNAIVERRLYVTGATSGTIWATLITL